MWKLISLCILLSIYSTNTFSKSVYEEYLAARNLLNNARSNNDNYDLALEKLDLVIERSQKLPEAYFLRSDIWVVKGHYKKAENDLKKAMALNPNSSDYIEQLALIKSYQNNYEQAIDYFDKAIMLDDLNTTAFINRGYLYFRLGKYEKALENYNLALKLKPFHPTALNNRGRLFYTLEEYNDYQLAEKNDPLSPVPAFYQGLILEKRGNIHETVEKFTNSINLSNKFPEPFKDPYLARSRVWNKLGELEKSDDDLNYAKKLNIRLYPNINQP